MTSVVIQNPVTSTGKAAFETCTHLLSVTGVERIGDCTVEGCSSLSRVNISDSVEYIGDGAICNRLSSLYIPYGVKSIGDVSFLGTNLSSTSMPDRITSLDYGCFAYCYNLLSMQLSSTKLSLVTAESSASSE